MNDQDDPGGETRVSVTDEQDHPVDATRLRRIAERALEAAGVLPGHMLSVALVGSDRMAELKGRYYGEERATDVLSFPMDLLDAPAPAVLGDVVICVEVAERQARALGLTLDAELEHLLVHGILHLAGLDHATAGDEVRMARAERGVLSRARTAVS